MVRVHRLTRPLAIAESASSAAELLRTAGHHVLAEAISLWLAGASLDDALNLAPGWRQHVRDKARTTALRRLAGLLPAGSARATAQAAATLIARYEATAWRRDRAAGRRPAGVPGAAYDVLAAGPAPSAATIRRVLRPTG